MARQDEGGRAEVGWRRLMEARTHEVDGPEEQPRRRVVCVHMVAVECRRPHLDAGGDAAASAIALAALARPGAETTRLLLLLYAPPRPTGTQTRHLQASATSVA